MIAPANQTNQTNGTTGNDTQMPEVCLPQYEFFAVQSISSEIYFDDVAGGYLGLGFDLPDNGPSFITTLKEQGLIEKRQVAVGIVEKTAIV